jgi:hypothetical protein
VVALNKKLIVLLFPIFMLAGCREDVKVEAYRELRTRPPSEVERQVMALPPHEQVALYVMAISYFRPSDTQLAPVLAKQGTKILPALIAQLEKADPNVSPEELVLVLYMMYTRYDVEEAGQYAPQIDGWCSRFFKIETYCHKMGRDMLSLRNSK